MRRIITLALLLTLALTLAGCEQATDNGWRLERNPTVELGDADPLSRVIDALRLPDGRIVVANAGTSDLRYYDSAGAALGSAGGLADVEALAWLALLPPDSVLAYDSRRRMLSVYDASGNRARSEQVAALPGQPLQMIGRYDDGSLLVLTRDPLVMGQQGVRRDTALYLRVRADGAILDTIGQFPTAEFYHGLTGSAPRAFGAATYFDFHNGKLYLGTGGNYTIGVYNERGELERELRVARPKRPVTREDRTRYERALLETQDSVGQELMRRLLTEMPFPDSMPTHAQIRVDTDGNAWVRDYDWEQGTPQQWDIFDAQGQLIGSIEIPADFVVLEIGADYLLGRNTAADRVRLYGIQKPHAEPQR